TDPNGATLHYRWRSTDGRIRNINAPTTTWTLPSGAGLHFAYVLVSNGAGGYGERRIAVNTDTSGTTLAPTTPVAYLAPAASAPAGEVYRSFLVGGGLL